jgi:2-oxoglutarate dehydrogenase E2 component (dihydrolipoamide succinyltransferase)
MTIKVTVPPLGESVTEATIAKWHKNESDFVNQDELLVELETDKVTLEVNALASGVLQAVKFKVGDIVKIGQELAEIDNSAQEGSAVKQPVAEKSLQVSSTDTKIASPAAAKISKESAVDLNNIAGSGKDGRITKGDVMDAVSSAASCALSRNAEPREERVRMSALRKKIAQRLKESQDTAAILTTFNEIDMFNVINMRSQYKEAFEKKHGVKLGFMSFFVKAAVNALKEIPAVNAQIDGDDLVYKNYYDIGVAVGTEKGLVVPVVRDADLMSFADIEKKIGDLGKRARDGKLAMDELLGGTFSITNGGVYGSLLSTPIINPPQAGILGMHKTQDRPVAVNGKVEIRPMMYVALSYDHRIIDGKEAVTFLVRIKEAIENPERLLFDL